MPAHRSQSSETPNDDDLRRLVVASTTAASSTPYRYEFTYDALGNKTSEIQGFSSIPLSNSYVDFQKASSQYAHISNDLGINGGAATIELWFKPESTPSNNTMNLVHHMETAHDTELALRYWNDGSPLRFLSDRSQGLTIFLNRP